MKSWCFIGTFFALLLAACSCTDTAPTGICHPDRRLTTIDSLMWQQPDSAFSQLQAFAESPAMDSLDAFNGHYFHLLLSELLYKNDYAQTNRNELLQAVGYYDSLMVEEGNHVHLDLAFLDARAHYINGVGYYEMDSVVPACVEYLKALEIMEDHFDEKDLVGYKANCMALVYTHLCSLFSDQYLHEQAIYFGKQSLIYFYKHYAEPWHLSWMYNEIGSHYDMMDKCDSANCYYLKALEILTDTSNLNFRITSGHLAFLSYKTTGNAKLALPQLYHLLDLSESDKEFFSGCLSIGEIFYEEKMYDSAWKYLSMVFDESPSIDSRKQAAEWLVEICMAQERESASACYANFLVPFANQNENKSTLKSKISNHYSNYILQWQNRQHRKDTSLRMKWIGILVLGVIVLMMTIAWLYYGNKRNKKHLEKQIQEERHAHKVKQKAMGGRLKESNEALRIQRSNNRELLQELENQHNQSKWSSLDAFLNEAVCQEILESLKDKYIKREAKSEDYSELQLDEAQLSQLLVAVERHFEGFCNFLTDRYPKIHRNEMNQCLLCLLNLEDVQIAALLHSDYSTIKKRAAKLKKAFHTEKNLQLYIRELVL